MPPLATTSGSPSQQVQALSHRLGVTLPADFGQVVVFHSTSLQQAQEGLKKLHRSLVLILVLTVVLFALALVVAPFKLRTLAQLGIGAAIVGLLTWAGTMWATNHIVQLVKSGDTKSAIRAILNAETGGLTELVILIAIIGVVAALLAFVFGESPQAGRIRAAVGRATARLPAVGRGALAFTNAHAGGARVLGYVVGLAILFIWLTWTAFFVALAVVGALAGGGRAHRTSGRQLVGRAAFRRRAVPKPGGGAARPAGLTHSGGDYSRSSARPWVITRAPAQSASKA